MISPLWLSKIPFKENLGLLNSNLTSKTNDYVIFHQWRNSRFSNLYSSHPLIRYFWNRLFGIYFFRESWYDYGILKMTHRDLFGTFCSILDQRGCSAKQFWLFHFRNLAILFQRLRVRTCMSLRRVRKSMICMISWIYWSFEDSMFYLESRRYWYHF